jgi:hypothetical protein
MRVLVRQKLRRTKPCDVIKSRSFGVHSLNLLLEPAEQGATPPEQTTKSQTAPCISPPPLSAAAWLCPPPEQTTKSETAPCTACSVPEAL